MVETFLIISGDIQGQTHFGHGQSDVVGGAPADYKEVGQDVSLPLQCSL